VADADGADQGDEVNGREAQIRINIVVATSRDLDALADKMLKWFIDDDTHFPEISVVSGVTVWPIVRHSQPEKEEPE
jgi:hypothetical protein